MMTYTFKVTKKFTLKDGTSKPTVLKRNEIIDVSLRVTEYDAFKAKYPELERYFDEPPAFKFEDMVHPPGKFMERMSRIQQTYPGARRMFDSARFRPQREW